MKIISDFFDLVIGLVLFVLGAAFGLIVTIITLPMQLLLLISSFLLGGIKKEK